MTPLPLPDMDEIGRVLTALFDREVTHRPLQAMQIDPSCGAVVTLLDNQLRIRYLWAFDWQLAHILSGALQIISPQRLKLAVKAFETPPDFAENIIEVVNVCRSAINGEGRVHVQIGSTATHGDGQFANQFWTQLLDQLPERTMYRYDCALRVVGYGTGRMSLLSLKDSE